jgi:hypothetical protein
MAVVSIDGGTMFSARIERETEEEITITPCLWPLAYDDTPEETYRKHRVEIMFGDNEKKEDGEDGKA